MALDVLANYVEAAVTSGGTTAPAAGTVETWTVTTTENWPVLVTGTQLRAMDKAQLALTSGYEIMLVTAMGPGQLTTALVSGNAYTTLAVSALADAIASGDTLTLISGTTSQTVVASAAAAAGATSVSVTNFTASAAFPVGTIVYDVTSGTANGTGVAWQVTRGVEGTAPVAHAANWTAVPATTAASIVSATALTAPLQLPAVVGKPLTTQGGNTLDDGTGGISAPSISGGTRGFSITDDSTTGIIINETGVSAVQIQGGGPTNEIVVDTQYNSITIRTNALSIVNPTGGQRAQFDPSGFQTNQGIATVVITSGALPTIALVSGTAAQVDASRDVDLTVPVTYSPTATVAATCQVAISADNVTYSVLSTETIPAASVAGVEFGAKVHVPAGWYVKLTVINAALGTGTYY